MSRKAVMLRGSRKFRDLINRVKAKYILAGKKPPTTKAITEDLVKRMEERGILDDVIIKL